MSTTTNFADLPKDGLVYYKGDMITREERDCRRAEDQIAQEGTPSEPPATEVTPAPEDGPHPIPHQLRGCRFILLQKNDKIPVKGSKWKEEDYAYDSPVLLQHIEQNHNYGVKVTNGMSVMDADNVAALMAYPFFMDVLMESFVVKSGREVDKATGTPQTGCHIYFYCPGLPAEKTVLKTADGVDLGDIRGADHSSYVVGPGSVHPDSKKQYEIIKDVEPVTIEYDDLKAFIDAVVPPEEPTHPKASPLPKVRTAGGSIADRLGLNVQDFLMPENPRPRDHQIEGNHPIHGGNTGTNLIIDPQSNTWWCRHCESGGGPLEAFAVAAGILDCSYFKKNNPGLQKEHWSAIFPALEKRGYKKQLAEMDRERRGLKAPAPQEAESSPTPPPEGVHINDIPNGMPDIVVNGRDLNEVTEDTLRALYLYNHPPKMFVRAGKLVRIETDEKGIPKIADMSKDAVRGRSACAAHFIRILKDGDQTTVYPPLDLISDVMALGTWPFPSLTGVIEAPAIRPDGTIIAKVGFDEGTGLFYSPTKEFRSTEFSVPDGPSQEEIDAAKRTLAEIICDFPFVDDASRINCIATMITPVVRNLVNGPVPMALFDKPQPGTGASLLTEIIGLISTGRPAAMLTAPTSAEEWRKTVTSTLIEGRAVVTVDNIEGKLYSPVLASVLTSETWQDRLLGRSEMVTLDHRVIWIGNGNNIQLGGDLPRRCYWVRLDAQMARPQERESFRHDDLRAWVKEHRPEILSAILVLARAWVVAGKPEPKGLPRLGSFEGWVRTLGGILAHAGYTGFLTNQAAMYDANDMDTPQWEGFLAAWHNIWRESPVTVATVTARMEHDPDLIDALPDYLAEAYLDRQKSFVRVLGRALSGKKDMRFPSGLSVVMGGIEHKVMQWKVIDTGKGGLE